jgi:hypothetical protein
LADVQKSVPLASLKSFGADDYGTLVTAGRDAVAMQTAINTNIEHVYDRLGKT